MTQLKRGNTEVAGVELLSVGFGGFRLVLAGSWAFAVGFQRF